MNQPKFSTAVRERWSERRAALLGGPTASHQTLPELAQKGYNGLLVLASELPAYQGDERVQRTAQTLQVVVEQEGTQADYFTILTRLSNLLTQLVSEDADVAGVGDILELRKSLHLRLEH